MSSGTAAAGDIELAAVITILTAVSEQARAGGVDPHSKSPRSSARP